MLNITTAKRLLLILTSLLWLIPTGVYGSPDIGPSLNAQYSITEINELADEGGVVANLKLISGSDTYGPDLENLRLTARYEAHGRLHVHITDATQPRWEVPTLLIPRERIQDVPVGAQAHTIPAFPSHPLQISWTTSPFHFTVTRRATGEILFTTASTLLVFKDQYLQFATHLPEDSHLYGVGDSTRPDGMRLQHGRKYTLWATDVGSWATDIPLYSSYPFVLDVRPGGLTHGFLFLNSNGMDVEYTRGDLLTFKAIGGVMDFYFFAGPSPLEVLDQFTSLVGRPAAMPYWSLGFHQSRFGYKNIEELETVMRKYEEIEFPVESIWADVDHMDGYKSFTLHPVHFPVERVRKFVEKLHANDQKFVFIIDPGIAIDESYPTYTRGRDLGVYLKNGSEGGEGFYIAQQWPGMSTIPDFLHPNAEEWWANELAEFLKVVPYDGVWIDMNEPANFCTGSLCWDDPEIICEIIDVCCMRCDNRPEVLTKWDNPPYQVYIYHERTAVFYTRTIGLTAQHYDGSRMYNTHNLYGMSEGHVTAVALQKVTKKRPFVLSRSGFIGSPAHTARWTGDNGASWEDLDQAMSSILTSGIFGAPMVGADICGFLFETTPELCERWAQVGAFYPFARSHSDIHSGPQEFYLWSSVAKTAMDVFYWRYRLLPFFYTLLYESSLTGAPVARPLFFQYPDDTETLENHRQFLLGSSILVSPVLKPNQTSVRAYFPKGTWYNFFDMSKTIRAVDHGVWETLPAAWDEINVHIRMGAIIPLQDFAMTTTAARKTPFTLLVALAPAPEFGHAVGPDDRDVATGEVFVDDDDQPTMAITPGRASFVKWEAVRTGAQYVFRSVVTEPEYVRGRGLVIDTISVMGVTAQPFSFKLNKHGVAVDATFHANTSVLELKGLQLPLGNDFELVWNVLSFENTAASL